MKSTDFYRQILGISAPLKIVNVDDMKAKRVVITAEVDRATQWAHPETKQAAFLHKWTERKITGDRNNQNILALAYWL